jgi:uncharacterized protein YgiM (DUF1202 family)
MTTTPNVNLNKFNSFINQASNAIMCDSNCQKQKQADLLKQKFQTAQANLATAPGQLQVAERNYVTLTQGASAYSDLQDQQLSEEATKIADQINELITAAVADITTDISSYNGLLINFKNVVELHHKYNTENIKLEKKLKNEIDDVSKNDRKTYYENQEIDNLKYYYTYFFMFIYSICVICFVVFGFIYPSQTTVIKRLFIFIGLIILPFISTWILGTFVKFIYYLYSLLPTNVYKSRQY